MLGNGVKKRGFGGKWGGWGMGEGRGEGEGGEGEERKRGFGEMGEIGGGIGEINEEMGKVMRKWGN